MTSSFAKILVATDFGAESAAALRLATSLARELGASIHMLHVARDPLLAVGTPEVYGIDWAQLREDMLTESRKELAEIAASVPGIPVTTEVLIGRPAEAIAQVAADKGANLIVMGTHGRGAVGHLLLGSVAERVIRIATCPVMTVRPSGAVRLSAPQHVVTQHEPAAPVTS